MRLSRQTVAFGGSRRWRSSRGWRWAEARPAPGWVANVCDHQRPPRRSRDGTTRWARGRCSTRLVRRKVSGDVARRARKPVSAPGAADRRVGPQGGARGARAAVPRNVRRCASATSGRFLVTVRQVGKASGATVVVHLEALAGGAVEKKPLEVSDAHRRRPLGAEKTDAGGRWTLVRPERSPRRLAQARPDARRERRWAPSTLGRPRVAGCVRPPPPRLVEAGSSRARRRDARQRGQGPAGVLTAVHRSPSPSCRPSGGGLFWASRPSPRRSEYDAAARDGNGTTLTPAAHADGPSPATPNTSFSPIALVGRLAAPEAGVSSGGTGVAWWAGSLIAGQQALVEPDFDSRASKNGCEGAPNLGEKSRRNRSPAKRWGAKKKKKKNHRFDGP